ncbi:ABC transporter ATP-binding protein [Clostridium amazonitimonense]|uniref:ABC transporter ATP-binding protein n=1 Tax=Clostridium amazonitimonense TaxID=1499689 RepID=UPI000509669A|nr:ABC transporter ATP-binding protein [Clostridium amazonitimonense]
MQTQEKTTFSWLRDFVAPHKSGYIASVISAVIGVALSILPYYFVAQMIVHLIRDDKDFSFYAIYCLIITGIWLLRYIFHGISTSLSHKATFAVISEVRLRLTDKLTRLPMSYLLDTPSGTLKNILVEQTDNIEPMLSHVIPEMSANLLISISVILYLFAIDWRMALASLFTLPIALYCLKKMTSGYGERQRNSMEKTKRLNAVAVEYVGGIEVIKAFSQSATSYEKFTIAAKESAVSYIDWIRSSLPYFATNLSVLPAVLVSVLPVGSLLYMQGTLSAESFILTIILSLGIGVPLISTMSHVDDLEKIHAVVQEIAAVLNLPNIERPQCEVELTDYDISLKNVFFAYKEKQILNGINLNIPAGGVTAFVGPSGGGKSTIAKLIASQWDVSDGSISIGGVDVKQIPLSQVNANIAYVTQDNYLFDDTVRNNIRMGKLKASDDEVERVAKESGCHEFIMGLKEGYETRCGGGGGHLSGGERQRITIARAMLKNAPIVILDEATAYTDPQSEAVIQTAVSKMITGKTLIVIAHRLSTIIDADKIVVVKDGNIHAEGTHDELLKNCSLYQRMWAAHDTGKDTAKEVLA